MSGTDVAVEDDEQEEVNPAPLTPVVAHTTPTPPTQTYTPEEEDDEVEEQVAN